MDSLFLLQFACFIFMFINAFIVALSCLHVRWKNKRYERSRWMIAAAITGLAIQYVIQMGGGFRAADDSLGAVVWCAVVFMQPSLGAFSWAPVFIIACISKKGFI